LAATVAIVAMLIAAYPRPSLAVEALDPQQWLRTPGVKLLAVEFYADWCKPCKKAVPKWAALHKKYRSRGLRVVVVTVESAGSCTPPGWTPDQAVCDSSGDLARSWKATELPQAFLWSWQGNLLVAHGTAGDVDKAVVAFFETSPRIAVGDPTDGKGKPLAAGKGVELRNLVRGELSRLGKFDVVADESEKAMIREFRKASAEVSYDENTRCKLGKEIAPNSVLKIQLTGKKGDRKLRLELLSLETSCLKAWANAPVVEGKLEQAAAEAVSQLLFRLTGKTAVPGGTAPGKGGRYTVEGLNEDLSEKPAGWNPDTGRILVVEFASSPPGAVIMVDGRMACKDSFSGCVRNLPAGAHDVAMHLEGFEPIAKQVELTKDGRVEWKLKANSGEMTVSTVPPGMTLTVDGRIAGAAPLKRRLSPGIHTVEVTDSCYYKAANRFSIKAGEKKLVELKPAPKLAAVQVTAEAGSGSAVRARVEVDGRKVGTTPGTFQVSICSKRLELVAGGETWGVDLALKEKQTLPIRGVMGAESAAGVGGGRKFYGSDRFVKVAAGCFETQLSDAPGAGPAKVCVESPFSISRTEVTQSEWADLMGTSPSYFSKCGSDCPVEKVTWWDALSFCNALSKLEGKEQCYQLTGCRGKPGDRFKCDGATFKGLQCKGYRLPLESEWELAARADCKTDSCGGLDEQARVKSNAEGSPGPVAALSSNAWGLYDTLGNVWEWVWNEYVDETYFAPGPGSTAAERGSLRVMRGCAWDTRGRACRLGAREHDTPDYREYNLGFRVAAPTD